jgi:TonB-linked SusC/RagA family outer membrane protein
MRFWGKVLPLAAAAAFLAVGPVAAQQTGTVTGTVVDATSSRPLESAQVFIPAISQGALTNTQGRFIMLNVPVGTHEIQVQLIGYGEATQQMTVTAGQTTTVEFRLESTALRLQELVVTGVAGATPKVKLPFTVESVDFTEMPVPAPSADGLIAGKVPGAKVVKGSGQPGSDSGIMLRGPTTITGTQSPLIIVDGVITDNTLADISSLDVEAIEVVKGAAAASLYGSRAQNGVVQIRTRRGAGLSIDQSRITVRNEYGRSQLEGSTPFSTEHPYATDSQGNILDADGNAVDIRFFYDVNTGEVCNPTLDPTNSNCAPPNPVLAGGVPGKTFQDTPYPYPTYDQVERFFDPGAFYSGYVAAEGRTGSTNYRASFTHQNETGVVDLNDGFKLNGFRLNLDHQIRDDLNVSLSSYYSRSRQDDLGGSPFYNLAFMASFADLQLRDPATANVGPCGDEGCFIWRPDPLSQEENPLYRLELIDLQDTRQRFLASATVNFAPTSWFELEGQFSLDQSDFFENNITPAGLVSDQSGVGRGGLTKTSSHSNDMNASITASFNKAFGDLTTRTKFRYLLEDQHSENFSVSGDDFSAKDVPDFSNIAGTITAGSSISDVLAEGFFFITALDYQGKYISDFLVRRDGSSLFGEEERWQTYYRASGAWRLAQEAWWPFDNINEFKLRYSIGTAGGRPGFTWQYETFSVSQGVITPVSLGNKFLKPELSTEQELGVEMVFFNKINTGLTYAWSRVEDQLLQVPLPGFVGFSSQWQNAGTLESSTVEAFIETALVDGPEFGWTSRMNFDRTRQEITQLDIAPYRTGFFYIREGEELGTFYGDRWMTGCADLPSGVDCGEFDVNDDGYLVYVGAGNTAGDGIAKDLWGTTGDVGGNTYSWGRPIKTEDEDGNRFLFMGNTTPDFNLSWSNNFRWKNFNLYALLDGEFGAEVYNQTRAYAYRDNRSGDTDQGSKPDSQKKSLDYYQDLYNVNANSSHFVEDGTFVKVREASLRYTFDQNTVQNLFGAIGIDGLSVNLIGRNLLTITDYMGYDPEVGTGAGGSGGGSEAIGRVDNFGYPNFRSFTAALEIIF